jgi:hypothetical protein
VKTKERRYKMDETKARWTDTDLRIQAMEMALRFEPKIEDEDELMQLANRIYGFFKNSDDGEMPF